jgi:carbon-monoxide dehydrogenase large subunit
MGANETGLIGQSVRRKEDARFLTGAGQYTDDVVMPRQSYGYFLRSPHAHAKIRNVETRAAKAAPGVVAVFTGADLTGVNGLPCGWLITGTDGKPMNEPAHPVLAQGKVRHVGDPVALVVAETAHQAKDAAEAIEVDYEALPAVVSCVDALKPGAPQVHDTGNKCYTWALGDKAAVDAAFRERRARGQGRHREQPACAQRDRTARGGRVVQPGPSRRTRSMSPTRTRMSSAC